MTIAQIVYDNELHFGYSHEEIHEKVPYIPASTDVRFPYSFIDDDTFRPSVMVQCVPCRVLSSTLTIRVLPAAPAYMGRHG